MIIIATDGSCIGNPGPGAFGFVAQREGRPLFEKAIPVSATTVGEMEVRAFIEAMLFYAAHHLGDGPALIQCDSQYVVKGYNEWMAGWEAKGWRKKGGAIAHVELWKQIAVIKHAVRHNVTVEWVPAHQNDGSLNDKVDALVNRSARIQAATNGPALQRMGPDANMRSLGDLLSEALAAKVDNPTGSQHGNANIHADIAPTDKHPLPWTIRPIDGGDTTKYEINDDNNFVVCVIDDDDVAQFIIGRVNA